MSESEECNYDVKRLLREIQLELKLEQLFDLINGSGYMDKMDKLDRIVFDLIIPFFSECFDKASRRPSHIQYYIRTEANDVFNLQNKTWVKIEDQYE
ncbi:hypothetical protein [Thermoactinomyces mirandus]|uniref:hypothetical protein n=1 Tax=Thermoactinomyces mirandus TaxID=2756294 RepID=UPI0015EFD290|nr:hypothetical protein [Thermoactinomyces mirandus]